jgi:hypothetical protein
MLSNCLNPACRTPFSHLRDGRVFSIESALTHAASRDPQKAAEQYWLCGTCSQFLKVVIEDGHITTAPIEVATLAS